MAKVSTLLALACVLAACLSVGYAAKMTGQATVSPNKWELPDFCHDQDCPEFKVLETAEDVELRRYRAGNWASTNISNVKFDDAIKVGVKRLTDYAEGHNTEATKLDPTLPFFTLLYPAKSGRTFEAYFTQEYFVPYRLQDKPPQPSAGEVNIIHVPEQDVWVKVFGGFVGESDVVKQGFDFLEYLQSQGKDVHTEWMGFAEYDPMTKLINRHNEIWIFAKTQPSATGY